MDSEPLQSDAAARPKSGFRDATPADIDRLESLTLDDFAVDFSRVKFPTSENPSQVEINAAVESFLDSLRAR